MLCNTGIKTSQKVIGGTGIVVALCGIGAFMFREKAKALPVVKNIVGAIVNLFNDENLPGQLKLFAYCYFVDLHHFQ